MAKVNASITISTPVENVFAYIDETANGMEFIPSITDIRGIAGHGVGKRWGWTYKMMGLPLKGEAKVIEHIPNQRYVINTTGGITSTWTWTFKDNTGETKLQLEVEYTIPVPILGKMAERLVMRRNQREAEFAMANLKEGLEWRSKFKSLRNGDFSSMKWNDLKSAPIGLDSNKSNGYE
ncbi:MAG: SRPBCC family protein [Dehalococcoidales bacterium]